MYIKKMIKKSLIILFCMIFLLSSIMAQEYKLEISTLKKTFEAGENITVIVNLYDSENKPVHEEVFVILEDAEKKIKVEKTITSNKPVEINPGKRASHGQGKITAKYKDAETTGFFVIEIKELAKFELNEDVLKITNIGNTKYTKTVQIMIGETTGIKEPKLNIGESASYRLIAPEGVYNIKVSDGKTSLTKSEVKLTGTGKTIGALDEKISQRSPVTGGIRPEEDSDTNLISYFKSSKFIYIFIVVVFGAMILLAIERRHNKKISQ